MKHPTATLVLDDGTKIGPVEPREVRRVWRFITYEVTFSVPEGRVPVGVLLTSPGADNVETPLALDVAGHPRSSVTVRFEAEGL